MGPKRFPNGTHNRRITTSVFNGGLSTETCCVQIRECQYLRSSVFSQSDPLSVPQQSRPKKGSETPFRQRNRKGRTYRRTQRIGPHGRSRSFVGETRDEDGERERHVSLEGDGRRIFLSTLMSSRLHLLVPTRGRIPGVN